MKKATNKEDDNEDEDEFYFDAKTIWEKRIIVEQAIADDMPLGRVPTLLGRRLLEVKDACGSNFAKYHLNQAPIIPTNFVDYEGNDGSISVGQQSPSINRNEERVQKVGRNDEDYG